MKRRDAVKGIGLMVLSSGLLEACSEKKVPSPYQNLGISVDQAEEIGIICASILPLKNSKYPLDTPHGPFVLSCVNDCMEASDIQKYIEGYHAFRKSFGPTKTYAELSAASQQELLAASMAESEDSPLRFFIATNKKYSVRNFTISKTYMEEHRKYRMIPLPYEPCKSLI